jgi:hypothetical protein
MEEVDEAAGIAKKHWLNLTTEQFLTTGYSSNQVFVINAEEANFYETGTDLIPFRRSDSASGPTASPIPFASPLITPIVIPVSTPVPPSTNTPTPTPSPTPDDIPPRITFLQYGSQVSWPDPDYQKRGYGAAQLFCFNCVVIGSDESVRTQIEYFELTPELRAQLDAIGCNSGCDVNSMQQVIAYYVAQPGVVQTLDLDNLNNWHSWEYITALKLNTIYYFRVQVTDGAGNVTRQIFSFPWKWSTGQFLRIKLN